MAKIDTLLQELKHISKFNTALALLTWDEEIYLPIKSHGARGEVNAALAAELHKKVTSEKLYKLVSDLLEPKVYEALSSDNQVIVRELKRDLDHERKLPTEFVEKVASTTSKAFSAWMEAKKKNDYKIFQPILTEIVELNRQKAEYIGYEKSPYDALIDEYEPEVTVEKVDWVFVPLAQKLTELIRSVKTTADDLPHMQYPIDRQKQLNEHIAKALGYDLEAGHIDSSPHPFTVTIDQHDVRITTRYDEKNFWGSLGSVIHETGHALYEQGLPTKHWGTPLAEAASLGIHESQSRTWENFVGRSRQFAVYLTPLLERYFGKIPFDEQTIYTWLNRIHPNPIRVDADEVTYNMHIILRYELEKDLIEGKVKTAELPALWNEKMKQYLGVKVKNDAEGVLQDIHWAHGTLGYFLTYTLGNLYAAQLFASAKKAHPSLEDEFQTGKFGTLLAWLKKNVHQHGRKYHPNELIRRATGEDLNPNYLLEHLEAKVQLNNTK